MLAVGELKTEPSIFALMTTKNLEKCKSNQLHLSRQLKREELIFVQLGSHLCTADRLFYPWVPLVSPIFGVREEKEEENK